MSGPPSPARQAGPTWWYVAAVAAFALATLAKGMTLTLPAVLLARAGAGGRVSRSQGLILGNIHVLVV